MGGVAVVGVVGMVGAVVGLASAEPSPPRPGGIRSTTSPIVVAPGLGGGTQAPAGRGGSEAVRGGEDGEGGEGGEGGERRAGGGAEAPRTSARAGVGASAGASASSSAGAGASARRTGVASGGASEVRASEVRASEARAAEPARAAVGPGPEQGGDAEVVTSVDPGEMPTRRRRRWGIGSELIGGGVEGGRLYVDGTDASVRVGAIPRLVLPTVEVQGFRRNGHSIDVSVPITNAIVGAVLEGVFLWSTDVFYSLNNGHGRVRQILGPGLGFAVGGARGVRAASVRVPLELGVEVLTERLRWGFKVLARPFFEYAVVSGGGVTVDGPAGGVLAGLGVSRYGLVR